MLHTVRLVVILDSGRVVKSYEAEMDDAGLSDYENKVKWGTMNTMEPFVMIDEKGNQVCIRPEKIESTIVERVSQRDDQPLSSFADEVLARGKVTFRKPPAPRPVPPQPKVEEKSGEGPVSPSSPSAFSTGLSLRVKTLSSAFRPPQPKVRVRKQSPDGPMDITVETPLDELLRQAAVSGEISDPAEAATQPIPKISETPSEPVSVGAERKS